MPEIYYAHVTPNGELVLPQPLAAKLGLAVEEEIRIEPQTIQALAGVLKDMNCLELAGGLFNQNTDQCPFIERGSLAVRWYGYVSPCLPLLYTHKHFLDQRERTSREYFVGNVYEKTLPDIWNDDSYSALESGCRILIFHPAHFAAVVRWRRDRPSNVRGCLWARGLIRCL